MRKVYLCYVNQAEKLNWLLGGIRAAGPCELPWSSTCCLPAGGDYITDLLNTIACTCIVPIICGTPHRLATLDRQGYRKVLPDNMKYSRSSFLIIIYDREQIFSSTCVEARQYEGETFLGVLRSYILFNRG